MADVDHAGILADTLAPDSVSILDPSPHRGWDEIAQPASFTDLNLDQVEMWLTRGRDSAAIQPTLRRLITDRSAIEYRLDVFDDLQDEAVEHAIVVFCDAISVVRRLRNAAAKATDQHVVEGYLLEAIAAYTTAVTTLRDAWDGQRFISDALATVRDFLSGYCSSQAYARLCGDNDRLTAQLQDVDYALRVRGDKVTVTAERYEADYSSDVLATFDRFRQTDAGDHLAQLPDPDLGRVETVILGFVARQNPELFDQVASHLRRQATFWSPVIDRLDQEFQFYLSYRRLMAQLRHAGLTFCRPVFVEYDASAGQLEIRHGFDLALALKGERVVPNDARVTDDGSPVIVTGPNQGGKTTFARMIGEISYLAGVGCPVPAAAATLRPADQVFTHFECQEDSGRETTGGKLEDDLIRIRAILDQVTARSVVIINEMFASTTLADAAWLGDQILSQLERRGTTTVWVTFVEALARRHNHTAGMVAQTDPEDPTVRTFEVLPGPPVGKIYAEAIAACHGLRRADILERIPRPQDVYGRREGSADAGQIDVW